MRIKNKRKERLNDESEVSENKRKKFRRKSRIE